MDAHILTEMIDVVRTEQRRRDLVLKDKDCHEAYSEWLLADEPFINEMCLMLLVTLRHYIERKFVDFAARSTGNGRQIDSQQYQKQLELLKKNNGAMKGWNWKEIEKRLKLEPHEKKDTEVLRILGKFIQTWVDTRVALCSQARHQS